MFVQEENEVCLHEETVVDDLREGGKTVIQGVLKHAGGAVRGRLIMWWETLHVGSNHVPLIGC